MKYQAESREEYTYLKALIIADVTWLDRLFQKLNIPIILNFREIMKNGLKFLTGEIESYDIPLQQRKILYSMLEQDLVWSNAFEELQHHSLKFNVVINSPTHQRITRYHRNYTSKLEVI